MRVIWMTNKLGFNLGFFMAEYDDQDDDFEVFNDARLVSQVFDIDFDVVRPLLHGFSGRFEKWVD